VRAHDDDEVVIEDVEKGTTGEQAAEGQAEEEEIHLTDLHFSHLFPEAPLGSACPLPFIVCWIPPVMLMVVPH